MVYDKERKPGDASPAERLPGSEMPVTISQAFFNKYQHLQKSECMRKLVFSDKGEKPIEYSYDWDVFYQGTFGIAQTLIALEMPERARVCFMGHNSPEHFMTLMGTVLTNCIFTEVYNTNGPQACLQQIIHSKAEVIVCDTYLRYKEKFMPIMKDIPHKIRAVIIYLEENSDKW
jgi:long-subunit acyl-CoA synthetase (AMP-forming)